MIQKRIAFAVSTLTAVSLLLAACSPQSVTPQIVEVTREVPRDVVQTQVVQQTQIVEVASGAFTEPHPVLSDLRVRQALAFCTNRSDLLKAVYPLLDDTARAELFMHTNIPRSHWAYAGDDAVTQYNFDAAKGTALLDEAGWTLADGAAFRTNAAGDELSLKLTTTTAAFRQTWAAVWEGQMADCGARIVRLHVPAAWLFGDTTGTSRRDFEIAAYAWTGQADPAGQTLYACDQIPFPDNNWIGQNYMGWCSDTASNAIKAANNTLIKDERITEYSIFQKEFTKDLPSIPLFNRTDTYAIAPTTEGFEPRPGQTFISYNAAEWAIPGKDTLVFGFTQEPASMFTLVESGLSAGIVNGMVQGFAWTSLDYDYAPLILKQLPTLESGLAQNNDVEVKAGDKVLDAVGNVVELAAGMQVRNAAGEVVEFTGDPVTMKQLVTRFEFREDLVWSDGTPVSQADYELKWKTDCDKESGATSFISCDFTAKVEFFANGYTQTTLPGVQSPTYFLNLDNNGQPDIYPAHLVLSDGRTLADVPASEWATLPEIAETPLGVGPYVVKEWVKGEKMVLEANPYYYGGAPKTKTIVLSFITAENAEAQLIGGQVDILDNTTLAGVTETLNNAAADSKIKLIVDPSATWEHIDFNLFLP